MSGTAREPEEFDVGSRETETIDRGVPHGALAPINSTFVTTQDGVSALSDSPHADATRQPQQSQGHANSPRALPVGVPPGTARIAVEAAIARTCSCLQQQLSQGSSVPTREPPAPVARKPPTPLAPKDLRRMEGGEESEEEDDYSDEEELLEPETVDDVARGLAQRPPPTTRSL